MQTSQPTVSSSNLFSNPRIEEKLRVIEAAQHFSSVGGRHRAKNMSPKDRSKQASKAAKARWKNLQANA